MYFNALPKRSKATIVQQMNCLSTKDMYKDFFAGKPLNIPAGSDQRSFDCESQTDVDWDSATLQDADNLIDQHFMREKYIEHFNPTPKVDPPADPTPADPPQTPPTVE